MSKKYRQRGYQDDEPREKRPSRQGTAPREDRLRPSRPRGRGLGAPREEAFVCADCGASQAGPTGDAFDAACEACGAALHTCTNCSHFDPSASMQCRQPLKEPVRAKGKANECEHFSAKVSVRFASSDTPDPGSARAAFDDLFRDL